ncbi:MAG TPA: phosphatidate cytidylyltransferase [Thermoanaerobaculia bacterium]|nr:phosphatidate cytidylyltransferase [Thermoanaerobaculia bacterium]
MKRLLTAAVGVPLSLLAIFQLPGIWFFAVVLLFLTWGALEYSQLLAPHAPGAPRWLLLVLVPPAAAALALTLMPGPAPAGEAWALAGGLFATVAVATLVLVAGTPPAQAPAALGILGFGVPYFALPVASLTVIQQLDPWLMILLLAIVWLGDTAAYYVGSTLGRTTMAPVISPNKSWEGAVASFLTALVASAIWSVWRLGRLDLPLLGVAAVTAVAAQVGDLVESLLKRSVAAKDSGDVLPGHGGMFDRMDALLFAAPVLLAGLWLIGLDAVSL